MVKKTSERWSDTGAGFACAEVLEWLAACTDSWREPTAAEAGERRRLVDVSCAPLITRPSKVVGFGPNYAL